MTSRNNLNHNTSFCLISCSPSIFRFKFFFFAAGDMFVEGHTLVPIQVVRSRNNMSSSWQPAVRPKQLKLSCLNRLITVQPLSASAQTPPIPLHFLLFPLADHHGLRPAVHKLPRPQPLAGHLQPRQPSMSVIATAGLAEKAPVRDFRTSHGGSVPTSGPSGRWNLECIRRRRAAAHDGSNRLVNEDWEFE